MEILSPVGATFPEMLDPVPGVASLEGKSVALLDNGHPGVVYVMARLRELLEERAGPAEVLVRAKPSFSRPCPAELLDDLARRAQAVVTGVGT